MQISTNGKLGMWELLGGKTPTQEIGQFTVNFPGVIFARGTVYNTTPEIDIEIRFIVQAAGLPNAYGFVI